MTDEILSRDSCKHFCYKCGHMTKDQQTELVFNDIGTAYCSIEDETISAKHTCKNWTRCR
jgi:hypothetical protein